MRTSVYFPEELAERLRRAVGPGGLSQFLQEAAAARLATIEGGAEPSIERPPELVGRLSRVIERLSAEAQSEFARGYAVGSDIAEITSLPRFDELASCQFHVDVWANSYAAAVRRAQVSESAGDRDVQRWLVKVRRLLDEAGMDVESAPSRTRAFELGVARALRDAWEQSLTGSAVQVGLDEVHASLRSPAAARRTRQAVLESWARDHPSSESPSQDTQEVQHPQGESAVEP